VTTTLSPPIRLLAIVGVIAVVGLGVLLLAHNRSASSSSTPSISSPTTPTHSRVTPATKPVVKPVRPKVALLPNLPRPVAHALRNSKVVVVVLFSHGATGDGSAVGQARTGAKSARSGFTAINVANEKIARALGTFAGAAVSPPAVLIVKRPGKIVNQFSGYADSAIIAQAALNAGAGR
jgi:hypothetical protein